MLEETEAEAKPQIGALKRKLAKPDLSEPYSVLTASADDWIKTASGWSGLSAAVGGDRAMDACHKFVKRLAEGFGSTGLDYAFTGALAVSYYGVPRTTTGIDVMVSLAGEADARAKIVEALRRAGLTFKERKIEEALVPGYNIASFRDKASPYTLDVIFSTKPLDKQAGKMADVDTFFQKPEELVLAKLLMVKATVPRERAIKDEENVKAVLAFTKVDVEAVKQQAKLDSTSAILEDLIAAG